MYQSVHDSGGGMCLLFLCSLRQFIISGLSWRPVLCARRNCKAGIVHAQHNTTQHRYVSVDYSSVHMYIYYTVLVPPENRFCARVYAKELVSLTKKAARAPPTKKKQSKKICAEEIIQFFLYITPFVAFVDRFLIIVLVNVCWSVVIHVYLWL